MSLDVLDRYEEETQRPWKYVYLLIILNSLIIFALFDVDIMLIPATIFTVFLIILLALHKYKEEKSQIAEPYSATPKDYLVICINYFRRVYKFFLASSIGLILAMLLISQTSIMSNSYQQFAFDSYIDGSDTTAFQFEVNGISKEYFDQWRSFFAGYRDKWLNENNLELNKSEVYGRINVDFMLGRQNSLASAYLDLKDLVTHEWTPYYYQLLSDLPTFPDVEFDPKESWLIMPSALNFPTPEFGYIEKDPMEYISKVEDQFQFNLMVDERVKYFSDHNGSITFNNITYSTDHYWSWSVQDIQYIKENQLSFPKNLLFGSLFLPEDEEWNLVERLQETAIDNGLEPYIWGSVGIGSFININIPPIEDKDLADLLDNIKNAKELIIDNVANEIREYEPYKPFSVISKEITSPLEVLLDNYLQSQPYLNALMKIVSIPLILISLYLFYFSLSLVEKRKETLFIRMKQRGATPQQLKFLVYVEILGYTLFTPVIAVVLSVLFSRFALSSGYIISSLGQVIPVIVPDQILWEIPLLAFLFAFNFSLRTLHKIDNMELEGTEVVSIEESFIERGNYDIILFVLAAIYFIINFTISIPKIVYLIFYRYLGLLSMVFVIIAVPILARRYLLSIVAIVAERASKSTDVVELAIQGIRRNRKFSSKFVSIFLLTLLFAYMGMVTSNTMSTVNDDISQYNLGGDILVSGVNSPSDWNKIKVDGVESMSKVSEFFFEPYSVEIPPGSDGSNVVNYHVYGINTSNYYDVAAWDEVYADDPLIDLVAALNTSANGVLFQSNIAETLGLGLGDNYNLYHGYHNQEVATVENVGTFDMFPGFITEIPSRLQIASQVKFVPLVTSLEFIDALAENMGRRNTNAFILNLEAGADPEEVRSSIYSELYYVDKLSVLTYTANRVSLFEINQLKLKESPLAIYEELFMSSMMNILLVVSLVTAFTSILYYGFYMVEERKQEVGIYRAFGMTSNQIQSVVMMEILILALISLVTGIIVGVGLASIIFSVISGQPLQTVPPITIQIPPLLFVGFGILIIGMSLGIAYWSAKSMANQELGNILRGE